MAKPIKVLIACGEGPYRTGLATILAAEPDIAVAGEAGDCQEAVERAVELNPDVILVDIVMTRRDDREAMLKIRERVAARVVVLADSHRAEDVSRALACGAQGYMLKRASGAEIVQAVRKAAAGESAVSPDIVSALAAGLRREAGEPRLTGRETEVFRLLGDGLNNREIADRLMVSVSTVRTYIYRIMEKLELKSRGDATACASRLFSGYGDNTGDLKAEDIGVPGGPTAAPGLSETEAIWSIFKDSATDFFCIWDSELNLVDISQSGIESSFPPGTKKEDLIGKNIMEFMPAIERTGRYQAYLTVIKTGKSLIFEDISPHPSYGDRRFTVKAFKLGDGMGQIITDITGHKRAEAVDTPIVDSDYDKRSTAAGGERKQATALFIGLDWSHEAEGAAELERLEELVRECLDIADEMMRLHGGMVTWFTGRALLALFGVPVSQEHAPQRAIHAALDIRERLKEHTEQIIKRGIKIDTRIGINTGVVVVEKDEEGTDTRCIPVANTAELAIKLQDVAGTGTIVVSESTYRLTRDQCTFQTLGEARMKADEETVNIYQLLQVRDLRSKLDAAAMRGLSGFVGRRTEIEALRNSFEKARSGAGQVIGIVGEAGMGKSRLALELRTVLPAGDYTYLEGGCISYDGSVPYLPLLGILRSHFDIREGEREPAIKKKVKARVSKLDEGLTAILSPLYDVLSLKVDDKGYLQLEPQQKKDRIYEAVRDLLIRESQKKPLILAIEDLHWIDKTSEEFITYLISFLSNIPILLILLSRPEYIHQWSSMSYYNRIGVNQLSAVSSAELVQSILKDGEVAPELLEIVTGRAGGNPLFIEEFTRTLLENSYIRKKDHQYVLSTEASTIMVPDTIHGIIAARPV